VGRYDAIFLLVAADVGAMAWFGGGRPAARLKAAILKGSLWATSHPTFGVPKRRRRLTTTTTPAGTTTQAGLPGEAAA